jgi:hypothetical protein
MKQPYLPGLEPPVPEERRPSRPHAPKKAVRAGTTRTLPHSEEPGMRQLPLPLWPEEKSAEAVA